MVCGGGGALEGEEVVRVRVDGGMMARRLRVGVSIEATLEALALRETVDFGSLTLRRTLVEVPLNSSLSVLTIAESRSWRPVFLTRAGEEDGAFESSMRA